MGGVFSCQQINLVKRLSFWIQYVDESIPQSAFPFILYLRCTLANGYLYKERPVSTGKGRSNADMFFRQLFIYTKTNVLDSHEVRK